LGDESATATVMLTAMLTVMLTATVTAVRMEMWMEKKRMKSLKLILNRAVALCLTCPTTLWL
jgi:hypothetical protein